MRYRKSFYDHGCTEEIADHVIDYGFWYQLHDSKNGNEQVMYVGWNKHGDKLWEIGIELYPEGIDDWAFHANTATAFQTTGTFMKSESLAKMKKLQQEARQHILERSKIEFRVDPNLMSLLLDVAKTKKKPLGPMIREWVIERVEQEVKKAPSQLDIIELKIDQLLSKRKASA